MRIGQCGTGTAKLTRTAELQIYGEASRRTERSTLGQNIICTQSASVRTDRGVGDPLASGQPGAASRCWTGGSILQNGLKLYCVAGYILVSLCLSIFPSNLLGASFPGFSVAPSFVVGKRARSVAVGDFNGDGLLDLAAAGLGSNIVTVLLGCRSGTQHCVNGFLPAVNYTVNTPVSVVVADVNGDGKLDLVVANAGSNSVSLLLGRGDGSFVFAKCGKTATCSVGVEPTSMAVGNFRGMANEVDLAVVSAASNTVSVLLGNGSNFSVPVTYKVGTTPSSVTVADFNGDGYPDLAVANGGSNTLSILLGDGKGGFKLTTSPTTDTTPVSVVAADFNGDGIADLAVANSVGNDVSILIGKGNGTFNQPVNYRAGAHPESLAVGDLNGDGKTDLVVANGAGNNVSVLLGNGDGTLQPSVQYASGPKTVFVAVADVNADTKLDIIVANANLLPGNVTVILGNGDGTFQTALNYGVGTTPQSITGGDFNCDGKVDLAVANSASNNVSVLLGNGNGSFQSELSFNVDSHPTSLVAADFNQDGRMDLAVANLYSSDVSVLLNSTCTGFARAANYSLGVGTNPVSIAVGDFNGDGYPDLVVANVGTSSNIGSLIVLLNNKDGTFGRPISFAAGINPDAVAVGDFNGDGKLDLAVSNQGSNNVTILLGNGDGTFTLKSSYCTGYVPCNGGIPTSVAIGDFNGDGKLDLAVTNYNDTNISVLLGNGDGTFTAAVNYPVGASPLFIAAASLQGNNNQQDLVVANSENDSISVLLNRLNGSGTFTAGAAYLYSVGEAPASMAVGDFNGDGKLDVAVANQAGNNVTVMEQH